MQIPDKLITYYIEWIRLLWVALIALIGGTVGLMFPPRTGLRDVLMLMGFIGIICLGTLIAILHIRIRELIGGHS